MTIAFRGLFVFLLALGAPTQVGAQEPVEVLEGGALPDGSMGGSGERAPACQEHQSLGPETAAFQRGTGPLRGFWHLMHWVGHGELYLLVALLLALGRYWRRALTFCVAMGMTAWGVGVAKFLWAMPRPGWTGDTLWVDAASASSGWPSGHAATAVCVVLLVRSKPGYFAAGVFAFLMALGRVGVGAHTPGQVLAGTALGMVVLLSTPALLRALENAAAKPAYWPPVLAFTVTLGLFQWVSETPGSVACWPVSETAFATAQAGALGGGLGLLAGFLYGPLLMGRTQGALGPWLTSVLMVGLGLALFPDGAVRAFASTFVAALAIWSIARWVHGRRGPLQAP